MTGIATQEQVFVMLLERVQAMTLPEVRHEMLCRGFVGNCSAYRRRLNLLHHAGLVKIVRGRGPLRYTAGHIDTTRDWVHAVIEKGRHHASQVETGR